MLAVAVAGCCPPVQQPARPAPTPSTPPAVSGDLPPTTPSVPVLDGRTLPQLPPRVVVGLEGGAFRRLTESDCLLRVVANVSLANLLDQENQNAATKPKGQSAAERLRETLRYYTALDLRNRAAAGALERFLQLTEVEVRTDLLRQAFPILDGLIAKARAAKKADVRFPVDPVDLDNQRLVLAGQLEQAEHGSRLVNLDLVRRLGLSLSAGERLWPAGDFTIDPNPVDPDAAVTAAMADRPELRGLRAFQQGLTPDVLPDVRDYLRSSNPLLGQGGSAPTPSALALMIHSLLRKKKGPDPAALAELELRKKQLQELIVDRERSVADEARAAALSVNSQRVRATLARDRFLLWDEKLADAKAKLDAKQPGAEFLVPQVQLEWLKARSEVAVEVIAWHQARIRLKAAQGWLVWEALSKSATNER